VVDVGDGERDDLHAVAVGRVVAADLMVGRQRAGEDEPDAALLEHVRGAVADAGLQPRVGDLLEAHRPRVEVRGLQRVADVELDVVDAVQRHEVIGAFGPRGGDGLRAHSGSPLSKFATFMIAPPNASLKRHSLRRVA
jgi:hypothetical protein